MPLSVINFATIFYYLLVEKVSALTSLFPSFTFFLVASILIFTPLSTALGWYYTRRSKVYGSEMVLLTEVNPLTVHTSRLAVEAQIRTLEAVGVTPSQEFRNLLDFWVKLDNEKRWRP